MIHNKIRITIILIAIVMLLNGCADKNPARYGTINTYYHDMTDINHYLTTNGICEDISECKVYDCVSCPIVFVEDKMDPNLMYYFVMDFIDSEALVFSEIGDSYYPFYFGKMKLDTIQDEDSYTIKKGRIKYSLNDYFKNDTGPYENDVFFKYGWDDNDAADKELCYGVYLDGELVEDFTPTPHDFGVVIRFAHWNEYAKTDYPFLCPEIYIDGYYEDYQALLDEDSLNWNTTCSYIFEYDEYRDCQLASISSDEGTYEYQYDKGGRTQMSFTDTRHDTNHWNLIYERDDDGLTTALTVQSFDKIKYSIAHQKDGSTIYTRIS